MAEWTWEKVEDLYKDLAMAVGYETFAREMLDLVRILREHPSFTGVKPDLAVARLLVGVPGKKRKIHINWKESGLYSIYFDHCKETFSGEEVTVTSDDLIPTLKDYLQRLIEDTSP